MSRIKPVRRGPAIEPVTHIRGNALLTPRAATEAAASSEAMRGIEVALEAGTFSSIARRPGVRSPVPEVTIKGRLEPASAEPRASMASLLSRS
jgi:hypothetical protein